MSSFSKKVDLSTLKQNKKKSSVLVYELVCISVHPVLWREGHFIEVAAVVAAFTWLDEHGWPLETLAIWTDKGQWYGARAAWCAAPSIRTHTAVVGPVEAYAHTFSVGQADGLRGFLGWRALLPFLCLDGKSKEMNVMVCVLPNWPQEQNSPKSNKLWLLSALSFYITAD